MAMLMSNYPSSPWLLDYILHKKINRSPTTLHIFKSVEGPFPDGIKMMQVGDGELFLKAEFSLEAFRVLDSESEVYLEQCLIKIEDWEMNLVLRKSKETSEYIIRIINFTIWCDERGLSTKHSMVSCESHPLIQEKIARLFEENQRRIAPCLSDSNNTLDSVSLSLLLEQIEKDNVNRTPSKNSVICAIPNGGRMPSVTTEQLKKQLTTTDIRDVLVHPEDAKILAEIGGDFQVKENLQEKSSYSEANAGFIFVDSSTFKDPSSKIHPQTSSVVTPYRNEGNKVASDKVASAQPVAADLIGIDTSAQRVSRKPSVVAPMNIKENPSTRQVSQNSPQIAPCSDERRNPQEATPTATREDEEKIRLFLLSLTSNERAKCRPLNECDGNNRSEDNSKNSAETVPDPNQAISASNTSNKDSAETSFEIPLSGKAASNTNLNKLNSDETDCNTFDSVLDASSINRVPRWKNLNLSSIESEARSDSTNIPQMSKKIKLSHAVGSTSGPQQGQLSNPNSNSNPTTKLYKNYSISESSTSKTPESEKAGSRENVGNKVPVFNPQNPSPVSLISAENTNSNNLSDVCENSLPVEPYEICHKLFPKHTACQSLLTSPDQLTGQNNMNAIVLNEKAMGKIKTYWSLSCNHIYQRRYWKQ